MSSACKVTVAGTEVDKDAWLRVETPGVGGRSVQVEQLAAVMSDDKGWKALSALIAGYSRGRSV